MTEQILALARALGHVSAGDEGALRQLCETAAGELTGRLREGITPEDCAPAFVLGASWLALAGMAVGSGEHFTAGDLTVQEPGSRDMLERMAGLRRQAEQVMAPYLRDSGFAFRGVRG